MSSRHRQLALAAAAAAEAAAKASREATEAAEAADAAAATAGLLAEAAEAAAAEPPAEAPAEASPAEASPAEASAAEASPADAVKAAAAGLGWGGPDHMPTLDYLRQRFDYCMTVVETIHDGHPAERFLDTVDLVLTLQDDLVSLSIGGEPREADPMTEGLNVLMQHPLLVTMMQKLDAENAERAAIRAATKSNATKRLDLELRQAVALERIASALEPRRKLTKLEVEYMRNQTLQVPPERADGPSRAEMDAARDAARTREMERQNRIDGLHKA